MKRRTQPPFLFLETKAEPNNECLSDSAFARHCQKWSLRALVDLGGHSGILQEEFCTEPSLIQAMGVSVENVTGSNYNQGDVVKLLKAKHREVMQDTFAWPEESHLTKNVRWLAEQVGLTEYEQRIVMFCVLASEHVYLRQALSALGPLNAPRVFTALSILLDIPLPEVRKALSPESNLSTSALLRLDETQPYEFCAKVELVSGLCEKLLLEHENRFDLFRDNFTVSGPAKLKEDRFAHIQDNIHHVIMYLRHALTQRKRGVNILVYGPPGTGKTEFARTVAQSLETELFEVAVENRKGDRIAGADRVSSYRLSQRILANRGKALICFDEIEDMGFLGGDDSDDPLSFFPQTSRGGKKGWLNRVLEENAVPSIWISNSLQHFDVAHVRRFDYHLMIDIPPAAVRAQMLADHVVELGASQTWCKSMAANDGLAPAMIARSARVVRDMRAEGVETPVERLLEEVMGGAMLAQSGSVPASRSKAPGVAYKLQVTNADCDLAQVVAGLRATGEGRLCLYGPPGTGKSAFALHVAEQLGLTPMLKRASDILSAYLGETEKRLAEIFHRASEDKAVLILDEADSFLMRREGARHSWEVTAVNEMLTQVEAYSGIFFATTNLIDVLDSASMRRFDMKIRFDYLNPEQCWPLLVEASRGLGIECPDRAKEKLLAFGRLTPGDFVTVLRQARLRPVCDLDDLLSRLAAEIKHKKGGANASMGFLTPLSA